MDTEQAVRTEMVEVCRLLYQRNLLAATDGNVSVRWGELLLTTPSGVNKGRLRAEQILTLDPEGRVLAGEGRPTTELLMHRAAYALRPDIGAVVHAHPPLATACTVAGVSLETAVLPEVVLTLGGIPTAPYATTGTAAMAAAIEDLLPRYDAILLDHHGALTVGRDLAEAADRMEKVEHTALVLIMAHTLGRVTPLPEAEAAHLLHLGISRGYRPPGAGGEG